MTRFWLKIFAFTFGIGVGTGIIMEFGSGTNWAVYSRHVGDIFGSALSAEGLFAFGLESTFLGVLPWLEPAVFKGTLYLYHRYFSGPDVLGGLDRHGPAFHCFGCSVGAVPNRRSDPVLYKDFIYLVLLEIGIMLLIKVNS